MFSAQDIQSIIRSLSPGKVLLERDERGFPPLLREASGRGFVSTQHVHSEFVRLVRAAGEKRLGIRDVARTLNVEAEVVLGFVRAEPELVLLGLDGRIVAV